MKNPIKAYQQTSSFASSSKLLEAKVLRHLIYRLELLSEQPDPLEQIKTLADLRLFWLQVTGWLQDPELHPESSDNQAILELALWLVDELQQDASLADIPLLIQVNQQVATALEANNASATVEN